ncbi:MAG TPA: YihY/virulence factor BrkB family protein [Gammaproteobacteria bacterium]
MAQAQADHGRYAERPGDFSRAAWRDVLYRVKGSMGEHNLSLVAAGAAFFGLLAIFPALAALVALYGLFTDPATVTEQLDRVAGIIPADARMVLESQLQRVASAGATALSIGAAVSFLLALWSASKGVKALMSALDIVYGEKEERGFVTLNATALLLTLVVLAFVVVALVAVAVVPALVGMLDLPPLAEGLARWLRWPLLGAIAVGILAVLYRYGPSRARPQWRWVIWGAVAATVLWLAGSGLFSLYVSNFGSYNETFGSVAAVVVLMMWFYLSAYFVLLGGELNAELEHQTEHDTTRGKPKPLGRRGAYVADTVGERHR